MTAWQPSHAAFPTICARQQALSPTEISEIVTTGTITNAYPVAAGESWKTEIDGFALPGLEIAFTA